MRNISNIDDLLVGVGNSQQPATPEHKETVPEPLESLDEGEPEGHEDAPIEHENDSVDADEEHGDDDNEERAQPDKTDDATDDVDDYGNKKERMSKGMKERLDRKEKQYQQEVATRDYEIQQLRQKLSTTGASNEVQQAVKEFQYDANDGEDWQQQLTKFVKLTIKNVHIEEQIEQQTQQKEAQEKKLEQQFQDKFVRGMDRFSDFRDVVGRQPIDDAMTLALRGMNDPSAFIYAVSKRQPAELERIAKIPDSYARMVEMGKLEERMRRNKPSTSAPRPLGRPKEDGTTRIAPKQKEITGDDLLRGADTQRLNVIKQRYPRSR